MTAHLHLVDMPRFLTHLIALLVVVGAAGDRASAQSDGAEFFEKNIRPLLAQNCLICHSAASRPVMGGLRLDSREGIEKGGSRGPAVVDGNSEKSLLIRAVRHVDDKLQMPPRGKLKDADIALLVQWVDRGAPWGVERLQSDAKQDFWAFLAPKEPSIPDVKNQAWVKSPIDAFVVAGLEARGLMPAPPADKRTLIRRATFDLTGLPPRPEEVRAFLEDKTPEAFARVVDRLLASPRYGERWGRHWLDVARYADSNGLDENLVYRNAFRYRDYVIQAFNQDKPYDRFIHEQLAGDLLPDTGDLKTTFERWTATGFLSLGAKMLAEDDPVKMEMDIVDEQLDTTSRVFMGLTVGCARCHDHKFDPIPQADYYSLAGIFKSSKTMENFKVVAKWHEYVLAPKADRDRLQAHEEKIEAKRRDIGRIRRVENSKLAAQERQKVGAYLLGAADVERSERIRLQPVLHDAGMSAPVGTALRESGSFERGNVSRKSAKGQKNVAEDEKGPFFAEYDLAIAAPGEYQIDFLEEEKGAGTADLWINGVLVKRGAEPIENRAASPDAGGWAVAGIFPLLAGKNTLRLEHKSRFPYFEKLLVAPSPLAKGVPVPRTPVQVARQYGINPGFLDQWVDHLRRSKGAPHSVIYGWDVYGTERPLDEWTSPAAKLFRDFHPANREELAARYQELFSESVRQWQALHPDGEVDYEKAERYAKNKEEAGLADAGLEALRQLLYEKFGPFRPPPDSIQYFPAEAQREVARLEGEMKELVDATPEFPQAMGIREGEIADLAIHVRGSHWTLGPVAPRRFLRVIAGDNQSAIGAQDSGRRQLAQWLTQKDHPLTSRVMANRIWRWHFGRGIVPSTDNFGRLGEPPTNQPLLDWLARRFIERGWSIKAMHRLIMLSNTYQMSSRYDARAAETDPENTLLWRMNRRRLEAENIRDAIMAVSGDLDFTEGGSILAYKDRQYVSNTEKRGKIDYDRNIRAVYLPVIRSSMYEVFQAFDLPDPSMSNGDRDSTVVAPQALFMMNGSVALEHSRKMAERLLARADLDDAGRIRDAYERALGRAAAPQEIDRALAFIARVERAMEKRKENAAERRVFAWQSFCKSLIASNEFIYLN
jgi:Protein of unknown function (DUF1553)/Protein of unknown function (DUF1549)/Planctomycete cytochrome C